MNYSFTGDPQEKEILDDPVEEIPADDLDELDEELPEEGEEE